MQNFTYLDNQIDRSNERNVQRSTKKDKSMSGAGVIILILILAISGTTLVYLMRHHDQVMLSFDEVSKMLKG